MLLLPDKWFWMIKSLATLLSNENFGNPYSAAAVSFLKSSLGNTAYKGLPNFDKQGMYIMFCPVVLRLKT